MTDERNSQKEIYFALNLFPFHLLEHTLVISSGDTSKVTLRETGDRRCSGSIVVQRQLSETLPGIQMFHFDEPHLCVQLLKDSQPLPIFLI
jgi:hypothetical protein